MNNRLPPNSKPSREESRQPSLRSRLILGNVAITFLAILGMGFYVYYRAQQANNYLTTQLSESVFQKAQDEITATSNEQSLKLNSFFLLISRDISNLSASIGRLISQDTSSSTYYWDAAQSLSRLSNGSWDNSNSETASIFIPAAAELSASLIQELNSVRLIDFSVPPLLESNLDVVALYFGGLTGETIYYPNIDLAAIVPPDFDVTRRPWFVSAAPLTNPDRTSVWTDPYLDAALNGLVITSSAPIYDREGNFRGVAAMDIQLNNITRIVTNIQVGQTGYAFLIDSDKRLIAMPSSGFQDLGIQPEALPLGEMLSQDKISTPVSEEFWITIGDMVAGNSGLNIISIGGSDRFVIYQPVSEVGYNLAIVVPTQELLASAIAANEQITQGMQSTILNSVVIVVVILVFALLATLGISNRLTRPLINLTKTVDEISRGDFTAEAVVGTRDEIGSLAAAFNSMTTRMRDMIANLENRVSERTNALERRALQIQAAAEVGSAAASLRNLDELLPRVTQLISQRFGFYHVGIFLMDAREEYAVLRASNSSGGQVMLARGHKLKVGQVGIVGYVTSTGNARIALDVGEDAVFFDNPDLPETRSEMALPLTIGKQIIGALDVQSNIENAFSEEDIQTLRLLADQLAIAIDNAHLFEESRDALDLTRRAYGEVIKTQWQEYFSDKNQSSTGITMLSKGQIVPVSEEAEPEFGEAMKSGAPILSGDGFVLHVPVKVMGNPIGAIRLVRTNNLRWTDDDISTMSALTDQIGTALESARLYEQITQKAGRESLVTDITSKIGSSIELETIMQTTVEEIGRIFHDSEIILQLKKEGNK